MSDETAVIAPPEPPMTDGEKRNVCYEFVLRMHKATTEYEDDLSDEFMFDKLSQNDWAVLLDQLDYPLRQFLEERPAFAKGMKDGHARYRKHYDRSLSRAIKILKDNQLDPVAAIFDALKHVLDARYALTIWRDRLVKTGAMRQRYVWSDPSKLSELAETFDRLIEKLRQEVRASNDLEICRCSRQSYLYREYLYIVAPDEFAEAHDGELIRLHRQAVAVMKSGPAREHTGLRLKKLGGQVS